MVGMGEMYIPAFALAIGGSSLFAGLVATLPMLAGSVLQLATPRIVARFGSHRRWVVSCVALQCLGFVPLVVGSVRGGMSGPALFAVATLYWAAGQAANPAWSTWMEALVPRRVRSTYFARRWRWIHVATLSALFAAGWILEAGARAGRPLHAFALIFLGACAARLFSTICLARQSEAHLSSAHDVHVSWRELGRRARTGGEGRLFLYMFSVQLTAQIAMPYITPFVLGPLQFSYASLMGLLCAFVLAKFLALTVYGKLAHRFGLWKLLWFGGLCIVPASLAWVMTVSYPLLFLAQLFSGVAWAAYELATFLLFFETCERSERTSLLTKFNLTNALAIVIGSLVGGALLEHLGGGREAFARVFALSTALRIGSLLLLRRLRESEKGSSRAEAPAD
jgi:MFS family permease